MSTVATSASPGAADRDVACSSTADRTLDLIRFLGGSAKLERSVRDGRNPPVRVAAGLTRKPIAVLTNHREIRLPVEPYRLATKRLHEKRSLSEMHDPRCLDVPGVESAPPRRSEFRSSWALQTRVQPPSCSRLRHSPGLPAGNQVVQLVGRLAVGWRICCRLPASLQARVTAARCGTVPSPAGSPRRRKSERRHPPHPILPCE